MNKISTIIDTQQYQQWLDGLIAEIDRQRLKAVMDLNADGQFVQVPLA